MQMIVSGDALHLERDGLPARSRQKHLNEIDT
jgi:hypothetical protein